MQHPGMANHGIFQQKGRGARLLLSQLQSIVHLFVIALVNQSLAYSKFGPQDPRPPDISPIQGTTWVMLLEWNAL